MTLTELFSIVFLAVGATSIVVSLIGASEGEERTALTTLLVGMSLLAFGFVLL